MIAHDTAHLCMWEPVFVFARHIRPELLAEAVRAVARVVAENGRTATLLGVWRNMACACWQGCCLDNENAIIIVPSHLHDTLQKSGHSMPGRRFDCGNNHAVYLYLGGAGSPD